MVDFRRSTLHVVSYSEPVRTTMPLEALRERLHTLPDQPDVVPYRTSYYERTWGFCLSHRQLLELPPGDYEVVIDSTLRAGPRLVRGSDDRGRGRGRGASRPTSATPRSRTTTSPASRSPPCSRSDSWGGGSVTPTASCSHPARSGRSRGCTRTATDSIGSSTASPSPASATAATSPTSAAGAEMPTSTRRWRPSSATRAPRTECSRGSHGAATSASSARPASTCRSAR